MCMISHINYIASYIAIPITNFEQNIEHNRFEKGTLRLIARNNAKIW